MSETKALSRLLHILIWDGFLNGLFRPFVVVEKAEMIQTFMATNYHLDTVFDAF